jgi:hypothetical protein
LRVRENETLRSGGYQRGVAIVSNQSHLVCWSAPSASLQRGGENEKRFFSSLGLRRSAERGRENERVRLLPAYGVASSLSQKKYIYTYF